MSTSQTSTARAITKSVTIQRDPAAVFRYLSDLANWPAWGVVNVKAVKPQPEEAWWDLETPQGHGKIRLRPNADLGILDHDFIGPDAQWTVPARVVPNGEGTEFMMTFFQPPSFTDDVFVSQLSLVDVELAKLKEILEEIGERA
ncbi:MAG TPA: SRPBCC family protein [Chloroflexota bacterium]|nr:SRPBCC family protein [Chloroflexota bacterium]